jgi:hypothetical protein
MAGIVDYDLHGLAGVRLVDPSPQDVAGVDRHLGLLRRPLRRDPDVVIRFVDALPADGDLRLLGMGEAGYSDDAFVVLQGRHKARTRVLIPFDRLGEPCEVVSERGAGSVPLLVPIVNLAVLARDALPLHASAFTLDGTGVVVTGWSKGGKTEVLLGAMRHGARFVGDEWVYVQPGTGRVGGLPEPMRLWDWHLRQLPDVRRRVARGDRARLRALAALGTTARDGRAGALVRRQMHVDAAPEKLFGRDAIDLSGRLDRLVLVTSWERPDIAARTIEPAEVARRMARSLRYERARLLAAYEQFRYAFPGRVSRVLEEAPEREERLLHEAFAGKRAIAVDHPYPVSLDRLFEAIVAHIADP